MYRMYGYVQDERYFAIEHMDVRREASQSPTTHQLRMCGAIVKVSHGISSIMCGAAGSEYILYIYTVFYSNASIQEAPTGKGKIREC